MGRLSLQNECDEEHVQVLAGDLNMREGEDQCFSRQQWVDAMQASAAGSTAESWTWKKGKKKSTYEDLLSGIEEKVSTETLNTFTRGMITDLPHRST